MNAKNDWDENDGENYVDGVPTLGVLLLGVLWVMLCCAPLFFLLGW